MTAIPGGIAISRATPLPLPAAQNLENALPPERLDRMKRLLNYLANPPGPEERAAQIAEQRAVKVHTVYQVNGKVVGIHEHEGDTTFASSAAAGASVQAKADGAARGLSGAALNDFVADRITAALESRYGSSLDVETYRNPAEAPTSGEMQDLMFGRTTADDARPAAASRIAYDPDVLALLSIAGTR